MQALDVISVNFWQIIISLTNLILLFLLVKKFLFGPVERMLQKRQDDIDNRYKDADEAKKRASEDESKWSDKLKNADAEAEEIIKNASDSAKINSDKIILDAREKADNIVKQAEEKARLEMIGARESIKKEIVDVSSELASKLIMRELNKDDHKELINDFIDKVGESDDTTV
ncbi:MAG: F0F1 ATP synthase subunit B [Ruminococcaceae bacterium]|nr:F0F1 ATP synthase subunit B [Oscillospiraceae bacterium]